MRSIRAVSIALSLASLAPVAARALDLPVLEDFAEGDRGWIDNANAAVDHETAGGPDGGAYVSASFNFDGFTSPFDGGPVLFRAHDNQNASQDAFVGDWLADGVGEVRAWVRQDTGEDLTYFVRFASAFNFPGAVVEDDVTVPSGVWTQIAIEIDPDDPVCQGEGVTCAQALADVGNLQIGTDAPLPLRTMDVAFTFDLDKVELREAEVPEPGQAILALVGALALAGARTLRSRSTGTAA
jgi:hypothetical protein